MPVLKARIGGSWVDVGGGAEEVAVQAADPGIAYDLWYDTDAVGVQGSYGLESARPATPASQGSRYFATDTKREFLWDGTGWIIMAEPTQTYVPSVAQQAIISKTITAARFRRSDGWVSGNVRVALTNVGISGNPLACQAPVLGSQGDAANVYPVGYGHFSAATQYGIIVSLQVITGVPWFQFVRTDAPFTNWFGADPALAAASGNLLNISFEYEMTTRYS